MTTVLGRTASARAGLSILTFAIALAGSMTVVAADSDELIKQGNALRRKGDDAAALEKFEQAYESDKRPRSLAQVALAEQALGRWVRAYEHLMQALANKSDPWIAKHVEPLEDALKTLGEHVGQLEILGGSPGAEVRINGALVGRLPLSKPLAMPIGTTTIGITARGYVPVERATSIRAGQITRESFDALVSAAEQRAQVPEGRGASTPPPPPPAAEVGPAGPDRDSTASDRSDAPENGGPSTLRLSAKWIAGGAAVLALAGGTLAYLYHESASESFAQNCYQDSMGVHPNSASTTLKTCQDLQNSWNFNYRLEVVGFVAGAAFAVTGVVLWLTEPAPPENRVARFSCAPGSAGPGGFIIGCAHSF